MSTGCSAAAKQCGNGADVFGVRDRARAGAPGAAPGPRRACEAVHGHRRIPARDARRRPQPAARRCRRRWLRDRRRSAQPLSPVPPANVVDLPQRPGTPPERRARPPTTSMGTPLKYADASALMPLVTPGPAVMAAKPGCASLWPCLRRRRPQWPRAGCRPGASGRRRAPPRCRGRPPYPAGPPTAASYSGKMCAPLLSVKRVSIPYSCAAATMWAPPWPEMVGRSSAGVDAWDAP